MAKGPNKSPNDSLQQSTTLPSTRSGDRSSLDASAFGSRRLFSGGAQIGGGSYSSYIADHMARMHEDIRFTTRKLELEQRRLHKVDKDLTAAELEYSQKRQKYKLFQSVQEDAVTHKAGEVRQLERHLEKAIADLNRGASENEQLREQIDQLRKERKILNTVFKQLERGIGRSGKVLNELVQQINDDKFSSDKAKQQTQAMNKMLNRERESFQKNTEELKQLVAEEGNVQREQDRSERDRSRDGAAVRGGGKRRTYMVADEEEAFSEPVVKSRILKLSFLNTIQRRHIKQHQKNIEVFEQAFATIKFSTGISDIEEIVKIFIILEQRNFSLLTYVNQLNREIESIEIRNKELQNQLNSHKSQETQSTERKKSALKEIEAQKEQTEAATKEKSEMITEASAVLDEVRPRIWNVVKYMKKEVPKMANSAYEGDAPPMKIATPDEHEENLNNYLMYIEEALMLFRISLSAQTQNIQPPPSKSAGVKRPTDLRPADLPIAHLTGDDSDDDEGMGDRMFSRLELKDKAQAGINKRRKNRGQAGKHPDGGGGGGRVDTQEDGLQPDAGPRKGGGGGGGDPGPPPPPKEYTASSVTSKDSIAAEGASIAAEDDAAGGSKERWWRDKNQKK